MPPSPSEPTCKKWRAPWSLGTTVTLTLADLAAVPSAFDFGTPFSLINYTGIWNSGLLTFGGTSFANVDTFVAGLNTWKPGYNTASGGENFSSEYVAGSFFNITANPV